MATIQKQREANSAKNSRPVLFDLDGVIVDNMAFENAVTRSIVQHLATIRKLPFIDADNLWKCTLESHRGHPRWHDYSYHCHALSLGDYWRSAHTSFGYLLSRCPGVNDAIDAARKIGPLWLVSDATHWVVTFKLALVDVDESAFSEVFTVDRCSTNKGQVGYWDCVKDVMVGAGSSAILYIDNREDRLRVAQRALPKMMGICVDSDDHPVSLGFGEINHRRTFIHSTHERLGWTLRWLAQNG